MLLAAALGALAVYAGRKVRNNARELLHALSLVLHPTLLCCRVQHHSFFCYVDAIMDFWRPGFDGVPCGLPSAERCASI